MLCSSLIICTNTTVSIKSAVYKMTMNAIVYIIKVVSRLTWPASVDRVDSSTSVYTKF